MGFKKKDYIHHNVYNSFNPLFSILSHVTELDKGQRELPNYQPQRLKSGKNQPLRNFVNLSARNLGKPRTLPKFTKIYQRWKWLF
jgi:hypothetical protein